MTIRKNHQKLHRVPYYIDILLNCLGIFNSGIISTFFTLRSISSTWNDFLQLITSKYLINCPTHHIFSHVPPEKSHEWSSFRINNMGFPRCFFVCFLNYSFKKWMSDVSCNFLLLNKPIGALPGCNYVLTRMVLQIILYSKW